MSERYSSVFLSHGAPTLPLDRHPAHDFLVDLGRRLPRPRAIVVLSPHWLTTATSIKSPARFQTWHDFGGFPDALYKLQYTPGGDEALLQRVHRMLNVGGIEAHLAAGDLRLDHGVWVPLMLMYPQADVPVVQVSSTWEDPEKFFALGRALRELAQDEVLVLGSGGAVHNLGELDWGADSPPEPWATGFDDWLAQQLAAGDWDTLCDYRRRAPDPARAHPTADHFLPLFFAGGAGGAATTLHRSFSYGNLSMAAYGFA